MKLVDRTVLRELAGPFFFGVAAFSSVYLRRHVSAEAHELGDERMPL